MKHAIRPSVAYLVIYVLLGPAFGQGRTKLEEPKLRDWSLADGSQESGELISVEIVVRLPNGETKNIAFSNISRVDQRFVTHWLLTNKNAKPIVPVAPKPMAKAAAKPVRKAGKQPLTSSGDLKLTDNEILGYLNDWKEEKPKLLRTLRVQLNARATSNGVSPEVVQEAKDTFEFVSRDDVLIVPRRRSHDDNEVFKYDVAGYPTLVYGEIDVLKIVDKRTICASLNGSKAFIEGVDTTQIPIGKWNTQYMFKKIGARKVPAAIGEDEVDVYQAVSLDGFPKDIVLW